MDIGNRSLLKVLGAPFHAHHYTAFKNMLVVPTQPWNTFHRYMFASGSYPYQCSVKTPLGIVSPHLYTYYDLLTLNEVFMRRDYPAGADDQFIIDVGSNIGLSALYFLTRNPTSRCILFEPDPRNVVRLKLNLANFDGRFELNVAAVSDKDGTARFGRDVRFGRYGGLDVDLGQYGDFIDVTCLDINKVLKKALEGRDHIDILKIDTEGNELSLVSAIDAAYLSRIKNIYIEAQPGQLFPDMFDQQQYGTVCRLTNRKLSRG